MRRLAWLVAGSLLVVAFIVYAVSGVRSEGPSDKIVQLILLVPAVLCLGWGAAGLSDRDLAESAVARLDGWNTGSFLLMLSLVLFLFTLWMAYFPLEGTAKGGDEAATLFQARIFARGRLAAPAPPFPDPEVYYSSRHLVIHDGKWFGQYTPTHSILLAPFVVLGISPLLGPLEGVMSLIGIFLLVRIWAGERRARMVLLLLMLSPFFLMMTPTHMSHNSNLMLTVWSLYLLSRYWNSGRFSLSLASGFLLGLAMTTKPYPIVIWSIFLFLILVTRGRKGIKGLIGIALGALPPVAGFAALNWYYTGDPLTTPYQLAREGRLLGFGENTAWFPVYGDYNHTLWRALKNGVRMIASGCTMLFGWPLVSLVPLAASVKLFREDRRLLYLFLMLPSMFIILLPHAWPAVIYGPRHYYEFLPVIMLLSLLGIGVMYRASKAKWGNRGGSFVFLALCGLFGISLSLYLPERIGEMSGPWLAIESAPWREAKENAQTPAVIFMQASQHGYPSIYSGLNYMSPFLDGDLIFCAHQTPEEDIVFQEAFPERHYYIYYIDSGGRHHVEPWTPELAAEIIPAREYHTPPPMEMESSQRD